MSDFNFKVIIVGGGLCGNLLGNGLAKHGIDFQVYERDERDSLKDGYQIRLGENSLIGMRACLQLEHMQSIVGHFGRATELSSDAPVVFDPQFNARLDLNALPSYSKSAPINRVTLRDVLAQPLLASQRLHHSKKFERYEILHLDNDQPERVRVWFSDGTSDDCSILIGADGNQSKVNLQVGLRNIEQLKSHAIFLTKCDLSTLSLQQIHPKLRTAPVGVWADNKSLYFCVYLPVGDGESAANLTGRDYDNPNASCMLALVVPSNMLPKSLDDLSNDQKWDISELLVADWDPTYLETVRLLRGQHIYAFWPRIGHKPQSNWRSTFGSTDSTHGNPRIWLMGDAIHPMLPNRGMGANQAMRDAADALPLLVELARNAKSNNAAPENTDIERACSDFEASMIPRAFSWVKKSGGNNPIFMDLSKFTHRFVITLVCKLLPVMQLGYSLFLRFWPFNKVNDAPEFTR